MDDLSEKIHGEKQKHFRPVFAMTKAANPLKLEKQLVPLIPSDLTRIYDWGEGVALKADSGPIVQNVLERRDAATRWSGSNQLVVKLATYKGAALAGRPSDAAVACLRVKVDF
jgi:hypothetical protein